MLIYLFLMLATPIHSLVLSNEKSESLLLPNTINDITPFLLVGESEQENLLSYEMKFTCSKTTANILEFTSIESDLCKIDSFTGTIDEINKFFDNIKPKVTIKSSKVNELFIRYVLNYKADSKTKKPEEFVQYLKIAANIPITLVNTEIYYQNHSSTSFNLKVLEISPDYFVNTTADNLKLVLRENILPDWASYSFKGNALYLTGETPSDIHSDMKFAFTIQDKLTGLSSDMVMVKLSNSANSGNSSSKVFILSVLTISSLVMFTAILLILIKTKQTESKANVARSIKAHNLNLQTIQKPVNEDVLSDSILQWNKKLILLHKERCDSNSMREDSDRPSQSPAFAYEQFDNSFNTEDENLSPNFRISDRLSDIEHNHRRLTETDMNRSSFFEEGHF